LLVGFSLDASCAVQGDQSDERRNSFDTVVCAARLMKAHRVEFTVRAAVHAGNADRPLEVYHLLRDEIGTRFIQLVPVVERRSARTLGPVQWGRFLIDVFDEWVQCDVGKVFVQVFDAALLAWLGARTLPDCEPGFDDLSEGYRAFLEHADHPMRIMADLLRRGRDAGEVMGIVAGVTHASF
jgi:uncharacterized protein